MNAHDRCVLLVERDARCFQTFPVPDRVLAVNHEPERRDATPSVSACQARSSHAARVSISVPRINTRKDPYHSLQRSDSRVATQGV